jgi:predicted nucleic acid-binding protein
VIVAFDTGMLSLALHQTARIPADPETGEPLTKPRERIEYLISELSKNKAQIIIPAPCLAEFLAIAEGAGPKYIQTLDKHARFDILPFDERAAIEAAEMMRAFKAAGDKRGGASGDWQVVKVDQQVVAIAKVNQAECIYASDRDIPKIAASWKVPCVRVWELPLPPEDAQGELTFEPERG